MIFAIDFFLVIDFFQRLTPNRFAVAAGAALFACGAPPPAQAPSKSASLGRCRYDAKLVSQTPAELEVTVECEGQGLKGLTLDAERLANYVRDVHDVSRVGHPALTPSGHSWLLDKPASTLKVSYKVDLEGMARDTADFDQALRVGESLVAPVSSWLLYPEPLKVGVPVTVHVHDTPEFATGLRRGVSPNAYVLEAHEIPVATYAVFGHFQKRELKVGSAGTPLTLAVLDGPLDTDIATLEHWVSDAATAVSTFWQRFPDEQALVTIVPDSGRKGVIFGKVLPESAPGVLIEMGEHTSREDLYADWILVHELFHIGFPSFYQEVSGSTRAWRRTSSRSSARARVGSTSRRCGTSSCAPCRKVSPPSGASGSRRARATATSIGAEPSTACSPISRSARRRAAAPGSSRACAPCSRRAVTPSEVWSLSQVLKVADNAVGTPVLLDLANAHAYAATPVDLDALWERLGVVRSDARRDPGRQSAARRAAAVHRSGRGPELGREALTPRPGGPPRPLGKPRPPPPLWGLLSPHLPAARFRADSG